MLGLSTQLETIVQWCLRSTVMAKAAFLLGVFQILGNLGYVYSQAPENLNSPKFESDIRPILREYCLDCHGATEKLEGSLDLRLVRLIQRGGDSGPSLAPGNPDASLLIQRIESGDMPPTTLKVSPEKLGILKSWVAAGAPTLRPEPESIGPGIPLTEAERSYWAYAPLRKPIPNRPLDGERIRTGVDQLLADAMPAGLHFSGDALRATLIRRAYFDVIGLPPTEQQFRQWMEHASSDWYDQLIESLLQSPHYGERWGRHWLDAAGYADSDGATLADAERPWAWKYRDYVIRSFNDDKPIDRFIIEQIAGDELAGTKNGDWSPAQIDCLTATGFLRMTADGTGSGDNSPEARNKTIADTMQVIGSTLLGSSLNCAQCHDHRYDPLSHEDYFAIRAVFEPALDWQQWRTPGERLVSLYTQADKDVSAQIEKDAQSISAERSLKEAESMKEALEKELMKYEEPLRGALKLAYETAADKRTDEQKMLLDKNPSVNISPGVLYQYLPAAAEELKKFDARIAEVRAKKPPETFLQALLEPDGHLPITKLFHRGDHNQPTREVMPGKLSVLVPEGSEKNFPTDDPSLPTSGRRLAFAKWLTQTEQPNPLFVRAFVNRIWMHHFGKAIVATPGDFGKLGSTPTHPQLLDWLGWELIEHGWSLKHLHRTILKSTAYRQSSQRDPVREAIDPENRFYWRKDLQRLDAEVLRDSILMISGQWKPDLYGPPVPLQEDDAGQVRMDPSQPRRSIYAKWRRTQPVALLQAFDAPVMGVNCDSRPSSTVATQSLMMMNNEFVLEQASILAKLVSEQASHVEREGSGALFGNQDGSNVEWKLPPPPEPRWRYGTGAFNRETNTVNEFIEFTSTSEGRRHAGAQVPDAKFGWVFLTATGGHPGNASYPAIRRWIAPEAGVIRITGSLSHGSENGDGVIGTIVSKHGSAGRWTAKSGTVSTPGESIAVEKGDSIDFVLECGEHETSDSFQWPIQIALNPPSVVTGESGTADSPSKSLVFDAAIGFQLQQEDSSMIGKQIVAAWRLLLKRSPNLDELHAVGQFVPRQLELIHREPQRLSQGVSASRQVVINICQMLLNSNEFLYVD